MNLIPGTKVLIYYVVHETKFIMICISSITEDFISRSVRTETVVF